jgi:hypothetical protein
MTWPRPLYGWAPTPRPAPPVPADDRGRIHRPVTLHCEENQLLTEDEARALAVRAQGFGAHYAEPIDVLRRLGAIQLDSVNRLFMIQGVVAV